MDSRNKCKNLLIIFIVCMFTRAAGVEQQQTNLLCTLLGAMPTQQPTLETARLYLRPLSEHDAPDIFEMTSDPEVAKMTAMFVLHQCLEDTCKYIEMLQKGFQIKKSSMWAVVSKESGKVIGLAGFVYDNPEHAKAEIGYALARSHWNCGYATEATQEIIRYGFEQMNLCRIQATVHEQNVGSIRVLEKCGMSYEGYLRNYYFTQGKPSDRRMYAVVRNLQEK